MIARRERPEEKNREKGTNRKIEIEERQEERREKKRRLEKIRREQGEKNIAGREVGTEKIITNNN